MVSRAQGHTAVARFCLQLCCGTLALILLTDGSHAWSPAGSSGVVPRTTFGRRDACQVLLTSICGAATLSPTPAHADVTNKVAGTTALRSLSRAQRQLPAKLLPPARSNDYVGVKACLREPPLDTLRKDMLTLVRGGEDGPKADDLLAAYRRLITSLEAIDATSSLGMRGRSGIDPFRLSEEYDDIAGALDGFVAVASEAAGIPLQEGSGQAPVGSVDARSGKVTSRVL